MIAKMKKLTFLVYHKEYDAFLNHIRDLGVIHVLMKSQGAAKFSFARKYSLVISLCFSD